MFFFKAKNQGFELIDVMRWVCFFALLAVFSSEQPVFLSKNHSCLLNIWNIEGLNQIYIYICGVCVFSNLTEDLIIQIL